MTEPFDTDRKWGGIIVSNDFSLLEFWISNYCGAIQSNYLNIVQNLRAVQPETSHQATVRFGFRALHESKTGNRRIILR